MAVGPPPSAPILSRPDLTLIPSESAALNAQKQALLTQQKYLASNYEPQREMSALDSARSLTDQGLFDRATLRKTDGGGFAIDTQGEGQAARNLAFRSRGAQANAGVTGSEGSRQLGAGLDSLKNQAQAQLRGNQNTQTQSLLQQAQAARDISGQIGAVTGQQTDFSTNADVTRNQLKAQADNAQMQATYGAKQAKHGYEMQKEAQAIQQAQHDAGMAQSHAQWYINFVANRGNHAHAAALAAMQ